MGSVPKAVPSAVAPSTSVNNVQVLTSPQLAQRNMGPFSPVHSRNNFVPVVPRTEGNSPEDIKANPRYGTPASQSTVLNSGPGAPSVPAMGGSLFTSPPIDPHYANTDQAVNPNGKLDSPYGKVNNPATRGMSTLVKYYQNHIATKQDVDNAGWRVRHAQQRTSVRLNTLPPHGAGYAPETAEPRKLPQHVNTAKYLPATGTQPYGSGMRGYGGVLNSDTFGAGQTAGGIGGNNYTPLPGPPDTTSTAKQNTADGNTGMPVWG